MDVAAPFGGGLCSRLPSHWSDLWCGSFLPVFRDLNDAFGCDLVLYKRIEPHSWTPRGRRHLGDLGAQVLVLLRVLEEVDKLQDLQLGLLAAGYVAELDLDVVLHHLGRGLAHAEGAAPAAAGAAAHGPPPQLEEQEADEQHGGDQAEQEGAAEEGSWESQRSPMGERKIPGANGKMSDTHPSLSLL